MTVTTTLSTTGPMAGDGSNATWPFAFPVQNAAQIQVIRRLSSGEEIVLATSEYSVALTNSGRSGGTVTYPLGSSRLGSDETLTIRRSMDFLQPTNLRNQGVLAPETLEAIADRVVYQILQTREEAARAVRLGASYEPLNDVAPVDAKYLKWRHNTDGTWDIVASDVQDTSLADLTNAATSAQLLAQAAADSASASSVASSNYADTATQQAQLATQQVSLLAAQVRAATGMPMVELQANGGTPYTHDLVAADKFCSIWRWSNDCTAINCTLNWHNTAADDGRRSVAWARVHNRGSNALTIQAAAGAGTQSVPAPADIRGAWAGTSTDAEPAANRTFTITVPAGTGRIVTIMAAEVNAKTSPTHTIGLTCSASISVTKSVADLASASNYSTSPKVNGVAWQIALADSASAATSHTLTFALPANIESFMWQAFCFNKVSAITLAGANISTDATSHSVSATSVANGAVACAFFFQGNKLSDALTGPSGTVALASDHSGTRSLRDITIVSGYLVTSGAASQTFNVTTSSGARQGCKITAVASPVAGTSSVTILGGSSVSLAAGGVAEIVAISDGVNYDIKVL